MAEIEQLCRDAYGGDSPFGPPWEAGERTIDGQRWLELNGGLALFPLSEVASVRNRYPDYGGISEVRLKGEGGTYHIRMATLPVDLLER